MVTFLIIIIVFSFILFLSTGLGESNSSEKEIKNNGIIADSVKRLSKKIPTVSELVKSVNTVEEFRDFEKKCDEICELSRRNLEDKYYEKLYDRYENAFSKIDYKLFRKIFYYEYVPRIDIETPLKKLNMAHTPFTIEEYKLKKRGTEQSEWEIITGSQLMGEMKIEEIIKKPQYFDSLIEFRKIIESKLSLNEKNTAITELVKGNNSFASEFFSD